MKKTAMLLSVLFVLTAFTVISTTWKSDPPNSQLSFTVKHIGINKISGNFTDFNVTVESSKPDFSDAVITMKAKTASINTFVEARDNHLRSADFFDAAKYPEITFTSTSIKPKDKNEYKITGNLTMHGITKVVTLEMEYKGTVKDPMSKRTIAGITIEGDLKRSDFNIGSKFTDNIISDKVEIKGHGEFIQQ